MLYLVNNLRNSFFLQNYAAGNPANVLYIKNLAKDVVVDDFHFIFGKLSNITEARMFLLITCFLVVDLS